MPTDPADNILGLVAPEAADGIIDSGPAHLQAIIDQLAEVAAVVKLDDVTSATPSFSSIPDDFRALRVIASFRAVSSTIAAALMRFNGDAGGNYDTTIVKSQTAAAPAVTAGTGGEGISVGEAPASTVATNAPLTIDATIEEYAGSTWKLVHGKAIWKPQTGVAIIHQDFAGLWRSTAAITALSIVADTAAFHASSRVRLFGLL
jgi:hypothetical protein